MDILDILNLIPQGKLVAIRVGSTDNVWPVEQAVEHYSKPGVVRPKVLTIDTVFEPAFGDEEPMVQLTVKRL